MNTYRGGCACGAVRYECYKDELKAAVCACEDCRNASGSLFGYAFGVQSDDFKIVQGSDLLKPYETRADSGNSVQRFFCSNCGSPVYAKPGAYPIVSIRVVTLDEKMDLEPVFAIYQKNIPHWLGLPTRCIEKGKEMGG